MDLNTMCRTCLEKTSVQPLFVESNRLYIGEIYFLTAVKIGYNDGLPQGICNKCIKYLNSIIEFRIMCNNTQSKLLQIIQASDKALDNISDDTIKTERERTIGIETTDVYNRKITENNNLNNLVSFINENNKCKAVVKPKARETTTNRVTCKICWKDLSVRSIVAHMDVCHPGADERKVQCGLCEKYVIRERLGRHRTEKHGPRSNICAYCKLEFHDMHALIDHVQACTEKRRKRRVSESEREPRECEVCHKVMQNASLRKHRAVSHGGLGPVCEHCGLRFGNGPRLLEHCRARHGYDKISCTSCDFSTSSAVSMKNHERRHRGERPFVCERCGCNFHAARLLAQHLRAHGSRAARPAWDGDARVAMGL